MPLLSKKKPAPPKQDKKAQKEDKNAKNSKNAPTSISNQPSASSNTNPPKQDDDLEDDVTVSTKTEDPNPQASKTEAPAPNAKPTDVPKEDENPAEKEKPEEPKKEPSLEEKPQIEEIPATTQPKPEEIKPTESKPEEESGDIGDIPFADIIQAFRKMLVDETLTIQEKELLERVSKALSKDQLEKVLRFAYQMQVSEQQAKEDEQMLETLLPQTIENLEEKKPKTMQKIQKTPLRQIQASLKDEEEEDQDEEEEVERPKSQNLDLNPTQQKKIQSTKTPISNIAEEDVSKEDFITSFASNQGEKASDSSNDELKEMQDMEVKLRKKELTYEEVMKSPVVRKIRNVSKRVVEDLTAENEKKIAHLKREFRAQLEKEAKNKQQTIKKIKKLEEKHKIIKIDFLRMKSDIKEIMSTSAVDIKRLAFEIERNVKILGDKVNSQRKAPNSSKKPSKKKDEDEEAEKSKRKRDLSEEEEIDEEISSEDAENSEDESKKPTISSYSAKKKAPIKKKPETDSSPEQRHTSSSNLAEDDEFPFEEVPKNYEIGMTSFDSQSLNMEDDAESQESENEDMGAEDLMNFDEKSNENNNVIDKNDNVSIENSSSSSPTPVSYSSKNTRGPADEIDKLFYKSLIKGNFSSKSGSGIKRGGKNGKIEMDLTFERLNPELSARRVFIFAKLHSSEDSLMNCDSNQPQSDSQKIKRLSLKLFDDNHNIRVVQSSRTSAFLASNSEGSNLNTSSVVKTNLGEFQVVENDENSKLGTFSTLKEELLKKNGIMNNELLFYTGSQKTTFYFDKIYRLFDTNDVIFHDFSKIPQYLLTKDRGSACVFTYGQSCAGKDDLLFGIPSKTSENTENSMLTPSDSSRIGSSHQNNENSASNDGLFTLFLKKLFEEIKSRNGSKKEKNYPETERFTISVSAVFLQNAYFSDLFTNLRTPNSNSSKKSSKLKQNKRNSVSNDQFTFYRHYSARKATRLKIENQAQIEKMQKLIQSRFAKAKSFKKRVNSMSQPNDSNDLSENKPNFFNFSVNSLNTLTFASSSYKKNPETPGISNPMSNSNEDEYLPSFSKSNLIITVHIEGIDLEMLSSIHSSISFVLLSDSDQNPRFNLASKELRMQFEKEKQQFATLSRTLNELRCHFESKNGTSNGNDSANSNLNPQLLQLQKKLQQQSNAASAKDNRIVPHSVSLRDSPLTSYLKHVLEYDPNKNRSSSENKTKVEPLVMGFMCMNPYEENFEENLRTLNYSNTILKELGK